MKATDIATTLHQLADRAPAAADADQLRALAREVTEMQHTLRLAHVTLTMTEKRTESRQRRWARTVAVVKDSVARWLVIA